MADLTNLESKLAEVLGLAAASKSAAEKVKGMLDEDERDLLAVLKQMRDDAAETEQRCTEVAGMFDGKKTAAEPTDWALPIQESHLSSVLENSPALAGREDPNEIVD